MIRLYAQHNPYGLLVRVGRSFTNMAKARNAAKALAASAVQVEIRNDALPRSKSLMAIFAAGVEIAR